MGVAIAVLAFMMLRTILDSWTSAAKEASTDRLGTRHKVTFVTPIPLRYIDVIRKVPGVKEATYMNWFGGKEPNHESEFFATMAVETETFLSVFDELKVPEDQKTAWLSERTGALVGDTIAKKFKWKVGDKITLRGSIFPGDWTFKVSGIYEPLRKSLDRSQFFFHWKYLNESIAERSRDQIGWITTRIDDPSRAASISAAIDKTFESEEVQTLTMDERSMQTSFLASFSAVLKAIDLVSIVVLLIMTLILGNTIAMGVRERTHEYGVLRAVGFLPHHLRIFILTESLVVGALGGAFGLLISYPLVQEGVGRWIEENMGSIFPYFRISPSTAATAMALALTMALAAAAIPAYRAARLNVVNALRRIE